jgi:hypothetical protein
VVRSEAAFLVSQKTGGPCSEKKINHGSVSPLGSLHEGGLMGDGIGGVGISLVLKKEVGHAEVTMGSGVKQAGIERQSGLVSEQRFDETDLTLTGGLEQKGGEIGGGQHGLVEKRA